MRFLHPRTDPISLEDLTYFEIHVIFVQKRLDFAHHFHGKLKTSGRELGVDYFKKDMYFLDVSFLDKSTKKTCFEIKRHYFFEKNHCIEN